MNRNSVCLMREAWSKMGQSVLKVRKYASMYPLLATSP
jgi:hypothetical protein